MSGRRAGGRSAWRSYAVGAAAIQAALSLAGCGEAADPVPTDQRAAAPTPRPSASTVPVTGPKRTILALGDSLYAGYGLRIGESLPEAIERRLRAGGVDATVVNAGVSGDTSAGGRARLGYTLDKLGKAPDLVLLGLGGNDVLRQIDPAQTRANMDAILDELERRRIPVVLTGMLAPPNLGPDFAGRFNTIFPELAREHDAVLDPFILQGVLGNRQLMLPDGIHPNATGVDRIADRVAPLVRDRLKTL